MKKILWGQAHILTPKEMLNAIIDGPIGYVCIKVGQVTVEFLHNSIILFRLLWAIIKAECKTMWTGIQYVVIASDHADHFVTMSSGMAASLFRYAKRRKFMRRPEMRKRLIWPKQ